MVSVDGKRVAGDVDTLTGAIRDHPGEPVTLVVRRDGVHRTLVVTPANGRTDHEAAVAAPAGTAPFGVIGVSLGSADGAGHARSHALAATGGRPGPLHLGVGGRGRAPLLTRAGWRQRFHQVTSAQAANQAAANGTRVESIVGAVRTAGQAAQAGVGDLLLILISINLFVGIFNLFPMLPLDGGHVAIAVYEKIRTGRRKVLYHADVTKLLPFTWLMVMFLGVLFATSLLTDILHPMANPFG